LSEINTGHFDQETRHLVHEYTKQIRHLLFVNKLIGQGIFVCE